MEYSPICALVKETIIHMRSFSSKFDSAKRNAVVSGFIHDLEKIKPQTLQKQWPGESEVRALRFSPCLLGNQCEPQLKNLYEAACFAFGSVRWAEFYEEDDWSRSFLPNFANGEGIGPDGRLYSDNIILGLFLLGPHTHYPAHAHPAEEFYLILTGKPYWQIGANTKYQIKKPGAVVLHKSNESHAIRTANEPLFCIYGWRGNINAKTWYRNDMADKSEEIKYPKIRKS